MREYQPVFHSDDPQKWQLLYEEDMAISQAIAGFREFGQDYSDYFEEIINQEEFDPNETTVEHLRSQAFQALEDYWAPLGEVAMQRQIEHYRELLDTGTELAQPFLDALDLPDVLIYFNKIATIKYCPYTNIPFIGTPYNLSAAGDWMAIPHELGHHLYWNLGSDLGETRKNHQALKDGAAQELKEKGVPESQQNLLLSWLEETFCDVMGARIGGVEFISKFKDFVKGRAGNVDGLIMDDGSHPPLCLRPFVREHALKLIGKPSGEDWDSFFKQISGKGVAELGLKVSPLNIKDIIKELSKDELLKVLEAEGPMEVLPALQPQLLPLTEIIPATEALVEYLSAQIDSKLQAFKVRQTQSPIPAVRAFEQLLALAVEDAESQGKPPYKILLRPIILERGAEHDPQHACWAHFRSHTAAAHHH